jgi:hypothetical protein
MGGWKAVSSSKVDEQSLREILHAHGTSWETVSHVTATNSLAKGVRNTGVVGLPIATLVDLIVLPGVPDAALELEGFPGPDVLGRNGRTGYEQDLSNWQLQATGRRLRLGIKFDDALRRFVRTESSTRPQGRLLVRSRREFSRTLHALIAAGISPQDLSVNDDLGRTAVDTWTWLEKEIPSLVAPREDLWIDFDEFQAQSTVHARNLRNRIEQALERAFGVARGRRVIVHHGFYFFTPPQWALFQLLRRIPEVDQIFVVHDGGPNPAFETWRRFFVDKWDMPVPSSVGLMPDGERVTDELAPQAAALLKAFNGESVPCDSLAGALTVLECRNPTELARQLRSETVDGNGNPPRWFAADAVSVERLVRRLGRHTDSGSTDLAQLPIGSFLLAIHDCIRPLASGGTAVVLTEEAILNIAASGYLETTGLARPTTAYVSALRRALPFFKGCVAGQQWHERAHHLHRLIIAEVSPLGEKDSGSTDAERIQRAVGNPFRLTPWGDLSRDEAQGVAEVISSAVTLVEEMASRERIALKDHMQFLRQKLEQGMRGLAADEQRQITSKVEGFSVGLDEEIDIDGLIDVVTMLLGRSAEFDGLGDLETSSGAIRELRGLDALGLHKQAEDLHVTNLAAESFPSSAQAVGWPFRTDDMVGPTASVDSITVEILQARAENAALSDLYLLWLALDGVEQGHKITLSWISDVGGERHSPSSILSLLTRPPRATDAIQSRAGGLEVKFVASTGDMGALTERPAPLAHSATEVELAQAVEKIDPRAGAASMACPRRLALQWILGQSPAFQSVHHHSMLHGNVIGALVKLKLVSTNNALRAANDLWRHLTPGQRSSSRANRRVHENWSSAKAQWILTLRGKMDGTGPIDLAYQAAVGNKNPPLEVVVPAESEYLPPGVEDPAICNHCPVRLSCTVWAESTD